MRIRTFCNDDISKICTLINSELGYDVTCKDLETRIMQMQEDENYIIFTAVDNEKIIGFIGLQMCLAFEVEGKIMRVIALAVARDFQNQGVGSCLIQKAEDYAKENNVSVISVNSGLKRAQAHQFYEKQSFYKKGYSFCKRLNQ
ncbi:GNAT family N-acetyltransferase [Bariatricus sp. SGI.154]|uniref:GNAT family N-acetyltransferase n=1 Tax=Bariatricus sp. SGI.154 TaxID=3420549 RepID=UPI003D015E5A